MNILCYIVFLIMPVLGKMSDQQRDIRLMASQCFASLVTLMPLEVWLSGRMFFESLLINEIIALFIKHSVGCGKSSRNVYRTGGETSSGAAVLGTAARFKETWHLSGCRANQGRPQEVPTGVWLTLVRVECLNQGLQLEGSGSEYPWRFDLSWLLKYLSQA